jgi:hypothetical protein
VELPSLLALQIRRVRFEPPKWKHFESRLARHREAIEFLAETSAPIPDRAYGPALFVGELEIHEAQQMDATTLRFLAFEPDKLEQGAPITWGWMKDPADQRQVTRFRFTVDDEQSHGEPSPDLVRS